MVFHKAELLMQGTSRNTAQMPMMLMNSSLGEWQ
jgi:hypothetical protein